MLHRAKTCTKNGLIYFQKKEYMIQYWKPSKQLRAALPEQVELISRLITALEVNRNKYTYSIC